LREAVLKEAKMEKKRLKDRPKFIYYRYRLLNRNTRDVFRG